MQQIIKKISSLKLGTKVAIVIGFLVISFFALSALNQKNNSDNDDTEPISPYCCQDTPLPTRVGFKNNHLLKDKGWLHQDINKYEQLLNDLFKSKNLKIVFAEIDQSSYQQAKNAANDWVVKFKFSFNDNLGTYNSESKTIIDPTGAKSLWLKITNQKGEVVYEQEI